MNSVELFAGCGGLAYGTAEAGFNHRLVVEIDQHAFSTLLHNKQRGLPFVAEWNVLQCDVRNLDYNTILSEPIHLVSGGPPCQPFSIGGSHKGPTDRRNMWPEAIRCVRETDPRAFIFENVRGLLRPAFEDYLQYVVLQLSFPAWSKRPNETDDQHCSRLLKLKQSGASPDYTVIVHDINTADYGAPQKRQRALIIGVKANLIPDLIFPAKTHSREALLWAKYISGEYWEKHDVRPMDQDSPSAADTKLLTELQSLSKPMELPWVTVRDTISDLPALLVGQELVPNHVLHPGARVYIGHTGSLMDEPAKALKAGAHGVPGGENVLVLKNGNVRYFTIREMARLQGLPDDYIISGAWVNAIRQLGNAVPVQIGRFFGREVLSLIGDKEPVFSEAIAI